jgi:rubrerythrin
MNAPRSIDSIEALKLAIQSAMDMKYFYEKAASLAKNDDAMAILKGLAEKEEKHRCSLVKTYSQVSGKKILYLNLGKKHKLSSLLACGDDPNEAVRNAKRNEMAIKNFYLSASRKLLEPFLRLVFLDLALEEEQHIAVLESSFIEPLALEAQAGEKNGSLREITQTNKDAVNSW